VANSSSARARPTQVLTTVVLVTALLYFAQRVLIPVALAILLAFILTPAVSALQRRGLGRLISVFVVTLLVFLALAASGWVISRQITQLASGLTGKDTYKEQIVRKIQSLQGGGGVWTSLHRFIDGIKSKLIEEAPEAPEAEGGARPQPGETPEHPLFVTQATSGWSRAFELAGPAGEGLASAFLVVVLTVFMLVQRENLRNRIVRLVGHGRLALTTRAIDEGARRISRFLLMQVAINLTFGLFLSLGLFLLGLAIDQPSLRTTAVLWGFLAFCLRFVPYLGTWVAAFLVAVFTLATLPGWGWPLAVLGYFIVLELLTANVVEPLVFGHSTGSSPLALLLAAAFWTWLWGPLGLVLSTPLTVILVVLGKYVPELEFFEVLLGDEPPLSPGVTFYQRLVARDQDEASDLVDEYLEAHGFDGVCADLLLPAITSVRRDRDRGDLGDETAREVYQAVREMLQDVAPPAKESDADKDRPLLLACPARDEGEELALEILVAQLRPTGYRAEVLPAAILAAEVLARIGDEGPAVVCIGSLPPGGLAQTRYLCKRVHARCPDVKVVVGRWGGGDDERMLKRLKAAGADFVTTTLAETLTRVLPFVQVAAVTTEKR
jgi:predicted PurR-regulated permease PerM